MDEFPVFARRGRGAERERSNIHEGISMLKNRIARLATTAAVTLGAAGAAVSVGAATASAAVHPDYYSCSSSAGSGICTNIDHTTTLWLPNNTAYGPLYSGQEVEITCWYYGNSTDGYWDHVVWETGYGYVTGHVDDEWVSLNNHTPNQVGIPEC
jgi:hypothetical protein